MFMNILMKSTPNSAYDFKVSSYFSDDVFGKKIIISIQANTVVMWFAVKCCRLSQFLLVACYTCANDKKAVIQLV